MKRCLPLFILALTVFFTASVHAREYGTYVFINTCDDLEEFLLQTDIDEDEYQLLAALCERPMNINGADRDMLYDLPGMTYVVAQEIVTYRAEHGAFARIGLINKVPGVTDALLAQIKPFVQVSYGGDIYSDEAGAAAQIEEDDPLQLKVKMGSIIRKGTGRASDQINNATEPPSTPSFMLDAHGAAFSNLGFGLAALVTRLTDVSWDNSRGALVGAPAAEFDLHAMFVSIRETSWSGILGSYDVGFGEKLVFDTTRTRHPHGWRHAKGLYRNNESGLYKSSAPLFGAALSLEQVDFEYGWIDATAFASYQTENLYQSHMRHGLDDLYLASEGGVNTCDTDTQCPEGYSCGEDKMCHSSRIYDQDTGTSYQYQTVANVFRELVTGANVTWSLNESTSLSVTGYRGEHHFVIAESAHPEFSGATANSRRDVYSTVGMSGRWGNNSLDTGISYAYSDNGGHAGLVRALWEPAKWTEFTLTGRWYTHLYDNPYARSYSAATTTFGNRRRNERGLLLQVSLKPAKWLRLVTSADVYNKIKLDVYDDAGSLTWLDNPVWDMRLRQSAVFEVSKKERLSFTYRYSDNDIAVGGRDQEYSDESSYEFGSGLYDEFEGQLDIKGKGSKHSWNVGLTTERLRGYRFSLHYKGAAYDGKYDDRFTYDHGVRGTIAAQPLSGARLRLSVAYDMEGKTVRPYELYWNEDETNSANSMWKWAQSGAYVAGRVDGTLKGYIDWNQKLTDWWSVSVRYGFISYGQMRQARYLRTAEGELVLMEPEDGYSYPEKPDERPMYANCIVPDEMEPSGDLQCGIAPKDSERNDRFPFYHIGSIEMTFRY